MRCEKGCSLESYYLWLSLVVIPTLLLPATKGLSLFPVFIFTVLYSGGLDYSHYQTQILSLDYNQINYERLLLYLIDVTAGANGIVILKLISLPLYILSVEQYLKRKLSLNIPDRILVHLSLLMIPHGYLAALTIFRQVIALSIILLAYTYKNFITSRFLFLFAFGSHLTSPIMLLLHKFSRYHMFVVFTLIVMFFLTVEKLGIYKSFEKLNYSLSYSYFLLFLSLSFLIFSLPLKSKTVSFQFLLLLILSCAVSFELLPSDILTRLINYGALFVALDILYVLNVYNKSLIGQLMLFTNFFIAITVPWFILDRVEYQIQL